MNVPVFIAIVGAAAWLYLLLFNGRFWTADVRLRPSPDPEKWPDVAAVIPARDEAAVIGDTIDSHMASDYPGRLSIVLVDDDSSDGTADIARAAAHGDERLTVIQAPPLPNGWSGKLWALNAGLLAAPASRYVLFTDADIRHAPDALRKLVAKAEAEDLALTSLMARLDSRGPWAGLLIPAFIYFFMKLYPFRKANASRSKVAAAAGGCMLTRRDDLDDSGGLSAIKGELIDDCAMARQLKLRGKRRRIWLGLADQEVVSLRDNRSLASIWKMVVRTAFTQLRYSFALLVGCLLGMSLLYVAPPVLALAYGPLHPAGALAAVAWLVCATTFAPTLRLYGKPLTLAPLLPIAGLLYTAMTIDSARRHVLNKGGAWKGRVY